MGELEARVSRLNELGKLVTYSAHVGLAEVNAVDSVATTLAREAQLGRGSFQLIDSNLKSVASYLDRGVIDWSVSNSFLPSQLHFAKEVVARSGRFVTP